MTQCLKCAERRRAIMDAWLDGRIADAVRELGKGGREVVENVVRRKSD